MEQSSDVSFFQPQSSINTAIFDTTYPHKDRRYFAWEEQIPESKPQSLLWMPSKSDASLPAQILLLLLAMSLQTVSFHCHRPLSWLTGCTHARSRMTGFHTNLERVITCQVSHFKLAYELESYTGDFVFPETRAKLGACRRKWSLTAHFHSRFVKTSIHFFFVSLRQLLQKDVMFYADGELHSFLLSMKAVNY